MKSAKARALLAFLATPPGTPRRREEITALLWSDREEAQARASLRQTLSGLRKALGDDQTLLQISADALSLDPEKVEIDEEGGGSFLGALTIRDPAYDEWVRDERLRREGREMPAAPRVPELPSIAVLPFDPLSEERAQIHLSNGMTQDIITALSKLPKLFVVARASTANYRDNRHDAGRIGREQGVGYILEGSVGRDGHRLRVSVRLIDAKSERYVWAERYDRMADSLFDLQDEITREVAAALQVEITEGDQARIWASGTKNREAWEYIAQISPLLFSHRREDVQKGRALAERALKLDNAYGSAWVWLGWSHVEEVFNGWANDPEASLDLALEAGERARMIDGDNPEAHILLGFAELCRRNFELAWDRVTTAISLGPNNAFAYGVAACIGQYRNDPDAAIPLIEKAKRLCPIYPAWYAETLGWAHLLKRQYGAAMSLAREAVHRDPDYIYGHLVLAMACSGAGRMGEAAEAVTGARRINPSYTRATFARTQPFEHGEVLKWHLARLAAAGLPDA